MVNLKIKNWFYVTLLKLYKSNTVFAEWKYTEPVIRLRTDFHATTPNNQLEIATFSREGEGFILTCVYCVQDQTTSELLLCALSKKYIVGTYNGGCITSVYYLVFTVHYLYSDRWYYACIKIYIFTLVVCACRIYKTIYLNCGKGLEHDRESWRVLDAVNPLGWRMWVTRGSPGLRPAVVRHSPPMYCAYARSSPSTRARTCVCFFAYVWVCVFCVWSVCIYVCVCYGHITCMCVYECCQQWRYFRCVQRSNLCLAPWL